jgi:hypothetical protein
MKKFLSNFSNVIRTFQKCYLLVKHFENKPELVWKLLIQFHKNSGFHHAVYEKERTIETSFSNSSDRTNLFLYQLQNEHLIFRSRILTDFDVSQTNDVLVLCSHLNSIVSFGVVRPDLRNRQVEFYYKANIVPYYFDEEVLYLDTRRHFQVSQDFAKAFDELIATNEDPVFIFSEFMRQIDQETETSTN